MSWNDGYERRKFEAKQKKQAEEYRALGMTEEQIQTMYEFDLEQYKSDRRYRMHTQQFTSSDFDEGEDDDSESTLLQKFYDVLTVTIEDSGAKSRYWWIEEIDNPNLLRKIKLLPQDYIELITLFVFEGYSKTEIACKIGCKPYHITRKFARIKKCLLE
jgi:DNA-directed RNA polymerase specialized sigma subunit